MGRGERKRLKKRSYNESRESLNAGLARDLEVTRLSGQSGIRSSMQLQESPVCGKKKQVSGEQQDRRSHYKSHKVNL